jgi:D-lyxose ketol-isomerase
MPVDHEAVTVRSGQIVELPARSRVTLVPGTYHAFYPLGDEYITGEVSTANDDAVNNFFVDPEVGRFSGIEEDEPTEIQLLSES